MCRRLLIWTICLLILSAVVLAQRTPSDAEIKAAISRLGENKDEKGFDAFEVLYGNPSRSAEILIASLKPVHRGQYIGGKHPQVVWEMRALRSLTGVDFKAQTATKLTEEESHFLDHDAKGRVRFFGTWMSRDRAWVAPLDAQIAIIQQWREWFARNGKTFHYISDRNFDNWYF